MADPYHLTVIGTRFPQLALATLLAKRGKRVRIVDNLKPEPVFESSDLKDYRFRKRPNPMFGLDSGSFLRSFLNEIGIGHVLVDEVYPKNKVSYQVVLPRHRLNIYPEREHLLAEIAREFPDNLETIRDLYTDWDTIASNWYSGQDDLDAIEKAWFRTSGIRHKVKSYFHARNIGEKIMSLDRASPEFAYFSVQNQFLGAFPLNAVIPPLSAALINSIGKRGTYQESTGTGGLTALMLQRFQEYGGELLDGVQVTSADIDSNDGLWLELSDGGRVHTRTLSTTAGIAATIEGLFPRLPSMPTVNSLPIHPVRFYIGVEERIVPQGMEDDLFLLREDEGGPLKIKSCYIALSPAGSKMAPEGKRSITVTSLLSQEALNKLTSESVDAAREDLLQALDTVVPFLGEGMVGVSTDLKPDDESMVSRALPMGIAAWSPGIVGRAAIASRMRRKVAIISSTPWELGIEGEALAAIAAAGIIKKAIGS